MEAERRLKSHIRRFVRRSLREGRSIRDPLRNRVTFAALCGVHCGHEELQETNELSPSTIRRLARRSLRGS